jgi:pyruvate/2-oxoglutarate dehydrogenase complex dihydrolipoamide acyltransferase (E2) component
MRSAPICGACSASRSARGKGFAFSDALAGKGGTWDFANLSEWLPTPKKFAPGTKMTFAGLSNPEDRANVIAFLNAHSDAPKPLPAAPAAAAPAADAKAATRPRPRPRSAAARRRRQRAGAQRGDAAKGGKKQRRRRGQGRAISARTGHGEQGRHREAPPFSAGSGGPPRAGLGALIMRADRVPRFVGGPRTR